jgi:hypothetical protein
MASFRHRFEMGITRSEFLRLLPAAVGDQPFRVDGDSVAGRTGGVEWTIRVEEQDSRRIALLTMPVTAVEVILDASAEQADPFMDRFLRAYQRAGG